MLMKKTIVICLNPFESHFIPTVAFSKFLLSNEYSVIYMGFSSMESIVRTKGFEYISLDSCTNSEIQKLQKLGDYKKLEIVYKNLHDEIKSRLVELKPDTILIGISRFHFYLLPALSCKTNIYFYSLCGGVPWLNSKSPPITSDYICPFRGVDRFVNLFLWFKRLLRKGLNSKVISERHFYPWSMIGDLCRQYNIKWKFGIDGFFPDFPVLVFGTKYLEPQKYNGPLYMGLGVVETSEEEQLNIIQSKKPIIYCSLGTMNHRYKKAEVFYSTIIEVFKEMPQWELILSTGSVKIDQESLPNNVITYEFAPQLPILEKADLVITHGGYATIKECIKFAVPMVVLPCSYDQRGNAARIQYHQLGIRDLMLETSKFEKRFGLNTQNITVKHVKELIECVLLNPVYKENIIKLSQMIEEADELSKESKKMLGED